MNPINLWGGIALGQASFRDLVDDLMVGDDSAAEKIVEEFTPALVAVARREIGPKLGRRIDADDIVQSAYRSFFVRMQNGEYDLGNGASLWKLLLTITLNKARSQGRFHRAQKRDIGRDWSSGGSTSGPSFEDLARCNAPGPADAAIFIEEVATFLGSLSPEYRPIVELRLQGLSSVEIAKETHRSDRTVRRILDRVRNRLSDRDAG